ncbi:MAG: hypothetical protein AB7W37_13765 [Syntrophobacteraceae bacterium]
MAPEEESVVINMMDDRTQTYSLPPAEAVVAAYEQNEKGNFRTSSYPKPSNHPAFGEYRRGFACGDWIVYKIKICA